jgi:hypothetical protein
MHVKSASAPFQAALPELVRGVRAVGWRQQGLQARFRHLDKVVCNDGPHVAWRRHTGQTGFKSVRALMSNDHMLKHKRDRPQALCASFQARVVVFNSRDDAQHSFFFQKSKQKKSFSSVN